MAALIAAAAILLANVVGLAKNHNLA